MKKFFFFFMVILPAFLFSATKDEIKQIVLEKSLYNSHIWHSLLHLSSRGDPQISTGKFLLTYPNVTPKDELLQTIEYFFENKNGICKYPARYEWLNEELNLQQYLSQNLSSCEEFSEYLDKTEPDNLKLVFVAEQVNNPSSMMGHTFFKLEGRDKSTKKREHSVSFFTIIDTVNIPYLIAKSTIFGMKGYFVLSPYEPIKYRYLNEENRNIWEYDLKLTASQRKVIYYHFWELKDIDMKYLFIGFNCATIIDDILSLTGKSYKNGKDLWVTPKDVIKNASANGLINSAQLIPSNEWEIAMLTDELNSSDKETIKMIVDDIDSKNNNFEFSNNEKQKELQKLFINSYSKYKNKIFDKDSLLYQQILNSKETQLSIDLSQYKNPINTSNDSQISLNKIYTSRGNFYEFNFLPASNTLLDDNREYFGESSLKIGDIHLIMNENKIKLSELNVFAMKSLAPWNNITHNLSSEFKLNYERQYDKKLNVFQAYNISGGMGYSKKIHDDVMIYGLFSGGLGFDNQSLYGYLYPNIGVMIYEVMNMKSHVEYAYIFNQGNSHTAYHDINLAQIYYWKKNFRFGLNLNHKMNDRENFNKLTLSVGYYF